MIRPVASGQSPMCNSLGLPGDRAHFANGVVGLLENGARFIEKSAAGLGQANRFGGAFE